MKIVDKQNTKIVATVGPASNSYEVLLELVRAGVDVFRLNFSHGTHEDHLKAINHIVYINEKYETHVGILADLQGPKLRVGVIKDEPLMLAPGDIITFVNEPCEGTKDRIYMSYQDLAEDVSVGENILVDDGKIRLKVIETNKKDTVRLEVTHGGPLKSKKGVNLPDTKVKLPALTEKDLIDLDFILTQPVNWIALSFVRSPKDLKDLRSRIDAKGHPAKIIAKIEKPEAVERIDKIIKNCNGIMIARGDLGVEMPIEQLPLIQKAIIKKCVQRARPVIVATQMMESMMENPSPTRPEVTDVANAVLDGADAVMLSGETATGKYPVEVVKVMNRIIEIVENDESYHIPRPVLADQSGTVVSDVVCFKAVEIAEALHSKAIIGMTVSGFTAFKVSSCRPKCKIYMFSDRVNILAALNLCWGVFGYYYDKFTSTDDTISDVVEILKNDNVLKKGDTVVNIGSMPLQKRLMTNMLKITEVE